MKKEFNLLKKDDNVKELFKDINYDNIAVNVENQSVQTRKGNMTKIGGSEFAWYLSRSSKNKHLSFIRGLLIISLINKI